MKRRPPEQQLALFAEPAGEAPPTPTPHASLTLAASLPRGVRFGTSSWTFPGWRPFVYKRHYVDATSFKRTSLTEYASHPLHRAVGLDRTYYAPMTREELARDASLVPADFRFVMKVWDALTTVVFPDHPRAGERRKKPNPHFLDVTRFAEQVALPTEAGLGAKLGAYVLSIPPAPVRVDPTSFVGHLDRFLSETRGLGPFAVELRDPRLLTAEYVSVLRAHGASHCFNVWARMPGIGAQRRELASHGVPDGILGAEVVVRLMLPRGKDYEAQREAFAPFDRIVDPQAEARHETIDLLLACERRGVPSFVVVNNKLEGSAPLTIEALARMLAERLEASQDAADE